MLTCASTIFFALITITLAYNQHHGENYHHHHHHQNNEQSEHHQNYQRLSPRDYMVDLINDLSLKLLAIHNENNRNNIAFSPYGAFSVLVALGEGAAGEASHEIQHALHIPQDIEATRVGLRDIHRHLKSYFIPDEGFLGGLTFNTDNVTLNSDYITILQFYGYNVEAFNSALYPEPVGTTTKTTIMEVSTTEKTAGSTSMDEITTLSESTTMSTTRTTRSDKGTTEMSEVSKEMAATTTEMASTTEMTTEGTTNKMTMTEASTSGTTTTTELPTTTTTELPTTTTTSATTTELPVTTPSIATTTELIPPTTEFVPLVTTTEFIDTTTNLPIVPLQNDFPLDTIAPTIFDYDTSTTNFQDAFNTATFQPDPATTINFNNEIIAPVVPTPDYVYPTLDTGFENNPTNEIIDNSTALRKRSTRSVVDYIIARYYDEHHHQHQRPAVPTYMTEEESSFLVYSQFKENRVTFMKYNTILPFAYIPHLEAAALSFPLDSSKYYLLLLLPEHERGIDKLICNLRLNGNLKYIIENLRYTHVIATIPSFKLNGYVTLTPTLQKLGILKVFEPSQADFTPMTPLPDIFVKNIEQAITVNIRNYVDPKTKEPFGNLHRFNPVIFKADHPFLYFVIDSELNVALMAGKIVNPINSRVQ